MLHIQPVSDNHVFPIIGLSQNTLLLYKAQPTETKANRNKCMGIFPHFRVCFVALYSHLLSLCMSIGAFFFCSALFFIPSALSCFLVTISPGFSECFYHIFSPLFCFLVEGNSKACNFPQIPPCNFICTIARMLFA